MRVSAWRAAQAASRDVSAYPARGSTARASPGNSSSRDGSDKRTRNVAVKYAACAIASTAPARVLEVAAGTGVVARALSAGLLSKRGDGTSEDGDSVEPGRIRP
jgi:hypothetical protein